MGLVEMRVLELMLILKVSGVDGNVGIVIEADDDGVTDGGKTVEAVDRENR